MLCRKCKKEIPEFSSYCNLCGSAQASPARKPKARGNGQGTVYKRGDTWTAVVTKYVGTQRIVRSKGGFVRKKDALDYLPSLSFSKPKEDARTFKALYDEWSGTHYANISASKQTAYKIAYNRCEPLWYYSWASLGLADMQKTVDDRADTYYTRRDMKNLMNQMGKYAIQAGYTDKNFADYIKLPPLEKPHKEAFTDDEIAALWADYAQYEFTGSILIMIYTGMRYGELATIKTENIHLAESYMLGGIKSDEGKLGEILILDEIKPIIKHMMVDKKLLTISEEKFRELFDETLARAGCRPLKPHSCRHTCATLLAKAGVPPAVIKEIMRHKSYATTIQYTHIDRETKLEALKAITHKLHAPDPKPPIKRANMTLLLRE